MPTTGGGLHEHGGGGPKDARPAAAAGSADEGTPLLPGQVHDSAQPGLWDTLKGWTRRRVFPIVLFSLLLVTGLIIALVVPAVTAHNPDNPGKMNSTALCLTPACIHAASEFLYNLSPRYQEIDACTNFEEMVCGGWRQRHNMRSDQGNINSLGLMNDANQDILRSVMESPYPEVSQHSAFSPRNLDVDPATLDKENFAEIQRAYNACMAIDDIKKVGIQPLQTVLTDLGSTFKDTSDISETILFMERLGIPHLQGLGVGSDDKDPNVIVISTGPRSAPGLSSKAYYNDDSVMSQYQDAISKVLGAVLSNASANAAGLAEKIVKFEKDIAAFTPSLSQLRDPGQSYNVMTLQDTTKLAPQLGLEKVLKSLAPTNYTIDRMITSFPPFLSNVSALLSNTPSDTVKGFFQWKAIQGLAQTVDATELKPYNQFMNRLGGKDADAQTERWRTCLSSVDSSLGWILSRFYIERAFSSKAKDLGNQIILDIKDQFTQRIEKAEWMDADAQTVAKAKVKNIIQKIGYPDQSPNVTDPQALQNYYAGLNISESFFKNNIGVMQFTVNRSWSQLGKPANKAEWGMTAPTVNAYYNPPWNEIVFPAGIMQFPLFGEGLPKYVNYAAFGAVAGHELSHAFDNSGRLYDLNGYLKDWWSNATIQEFQKRADCFIKEYSNFTVQGTNGPLNVNGEQTLGENIADAGGLSAGFSAWQSRNKATPDLHLPGLDFFTKEQLFYVAFGNVWCSKYTPQALTQRVVSDEHSPNMFRIIGTAMMNSRGFRQAYNCPAKEPVCEIWVTTVLWDT
ncbi:hypothetical protein RB601_004835 [Gaeumannomyces tritici]